MRFLHSILLIISLAVCYLLYFHSQSGGSRSATSLTAEETRVDLSAKPEIPVPATPVHSQYKADLDRAHTVANQMKAAHREADSF